MVLPKFSFTGLALFSAIGGVLGHNGINIVDKPVATILILVLVALLELNAVNSGTDKNEPKSSNK
jgi:hypothetical protein